VVVADGAAGGEPHPDGDGGGGAIDGVAEDELLVDAAALAGGDVAAVESGGDLLVQGGLGQKIAGELPDGELVEGQVALKARTTQSR
jgi:hypothetical protein